MSKRQPDKYDDAVAYLTEHPNEIYDAWCTPSSHPAGCLFTYVGPEPTDNAYGCLTQIHRFPTAYKAFTPELKERIIASKALTSIKHESITVDKLKYFAMWQRRIDKAREEYHRAQAAERRT